MRLSVKLAQNIIIVDAHNVRLVKYIPNILFLVFGIIIVIVIKGSDS